jgi:hypothetical protein
MLLAPWMMMEPAFPDLKRRFGVFFVSFNLLFLVVASVVPRSKGGISFGFVVLAAGFTALN